MLEVGFLYAIGAAILWGLIYALDQKILENVSPLVLLFITYAVGVIITLPFVLADSASLKTLLSPSKTHLLAIATVILGVVANFFIFSSIKHLGASNASIIEIAYPFFVVLFSILLFKTTPNIYFIIGGTLLFIGSAIIIRFA